MLVAYNAYLNQVKITAVDISGITIELQNGFRNHRYLVGSAQDFYYLWKALLSKTPVPKDVVNEYYQLKNNEMGMELPFAERFYSLRAQLKKNYFKQWSILNPLYNQMKTILRGYININDLFIVTSKDTDSVLGLLQTNNIKIIKEQVYGREINLSKAKLFRKIIKDTNTDPKNILYIEDNISHLIQIRELGIKAFLATWGYNSPSAKSDAVINGIIPISMNDLYSIIVKESVVI